MSNSIGDLRNSGLQGNNWPWQYKVLDGLQSIYNALTGSATGQVRTPNILTTTVAGSIPPGAYSFSVANVGAANGTLMGQIIPAGTTVNFDAGPMNNTLPGVSYDPTGTRFLITWIS